MEEADYSIETEDETDEDAFISAYSDEEVKLLLTIARNNSDIKLRRVLKELLYVRWIMTHLIDFVEDENKNNDLLTIQRLARNYVNGINKANK